MTKPMPLETAATGVAFRAGVQGLPFNDQPGPRVETEVRKGGIQGPSERRFEIVELLPGLTDPLAAYETGRALRLIGRLLDQNGAGPTFAQAFLDKLVEEMVHARLMEARQPWGAEETASIFIESHLSPATPGNLRHQTHDAILSYARKGRSS
jgi:hypothetical protein